MKIFKWGSTRIPLGASSSLVVPGLTECKIDDPEPEKFVRLDELQNAPVLGWRVDAYGEGKGCREMIVVGDLTAAEHHARAFAARGLTLHRITPLIAGVAK